LSCAISESASVTTPNSAADFFNMLNHTNFGDSGAVFGSPCSVFGSAGSALRTEAGMRILF
jgi:hypothetical protein